MLNSMRLAVDEANRRGGVKGRTIELMELDDASQDGRAAEAAKRVVGDARVLGVIASYDQDCSTAAASILSNAAVPNIVAAVATRETGSTPDFEFRVLPDGTAQMATAVNYAWDILGARAFLFVHDRSAEGIEPIYEFRYVLEDKLHQRLAGGDIEIKQGDTDFGAVIARALAEKPQYILFGGHPREAGLLLKQLRGAGVNAAFQAQTHVPSAEFIEAAQGSAEGAVQIFQALPLDQYPAGKEFLARYQAAGFREPPGPYGIFGYVEVQALLGAMEKSFLSRPSVRGALAREELDTQLGPLRFNFMGSTYQRAIVYQVIQGRWTQIDATDPTGKLVPISTLAAQTGAPGAR